MGGYGWRTYVPVAERRRQAQEEMADLRQNGQDIQPVEIEGREIATTFWGKAWCDHLELFSDYDNRLPRGRTYVRNGSVCHLDIGKGEINAMVSGSEMYKVSIAIKTLPQKKWKKVKARCSGQIGSLLELLQGRFSKEVMTVVTDRKNGLFPSFKEISLDCDCPDWAVMCKHVAAVLYGVGSRIDEQPDLLFKLRGVDHEELIGAEIDIAASTRVNKSSRKHIADDALADVFGIEISDEVLVSKSKSKSKSKKSTPRAKGASPKLKRTTKPNVKQTVKLTERTRKSVIRVRKKTAARKVTAKEASRASPRARLISGRFVARLRAKFGMSQVEFATFLGVSATSIGNWEKKAGILNLQPHTRDAINRARGLTKQQAWRRVSGL